MPTLIDTFGLPINIPLHKSEVGTTVVPFSVSSCRSVFSCVGLQLIDQILFRLQASNSAVVWRK
jgi:hypothetical protein